MYIIGSSRRRGISTILGTLISIGILFTAVIPMFLVMRQADTLYEKRRRELNCLDEERNIERIYVYAIPTPEQPSSLTVTVYNRGDRMVRVVRLWISERSGIDDDPIELDSPVESMSEVNLGSHVVNPQEGESYYIKVTTDRGNVFASDSNPLRYQGGEWKVDMLAINVLIYSSSGVLTIEVTKTWDGLDVTGSPATVHKGSSGTAFQSFDVTNYDIPIEYETYHVSIKKGQSLIHEEDVTMKWPDGPAAEWVFA